MLTMKAVKSSDSFVEHVIQWLKLSWASPCRKRILDGMLDPSADDVEWIMDVSEGTV